MPIPLGDISFTSIAYNSEDLANALEGFVLEGSRKGIVSVSDIDIVTTDPDGTDSFGTVKAGLSQGNKLFDMLMYFAIPAGDRPRPRALNAGEEWPVIGDSEIARCVFYLGFFLLTRANVPHGADTTTGTSVPAFLKNVLAYQDSPSSIMSKISSFELGKMEHKWIKHINWRNLGTESLNRIGLGPAGYRMLSPFKLLKVKDNLPADISSAVTVARSMATQPADWAIHPITRAPEFTQKYGPLNANLGNLMLKAFEMADLQMLVDQKVLFKIPEVDLRNTAYANWSNDMAFESSDPIFRNE